MTELTYQIEWRKKLNLKKMVTDYSWWMLLATNLITIYWAVVENWNVNNLLWIFWWQNIIIGFFHAIELSRLKKISTEGVEVDDRPIKPEEVSRTRLALFFLLGYGIFHLVYFLFLLESASVVMAEILPFVGLFFVNHLFSFIINSQTKEEKEKNIGYVFFIPFARIIPMHFLVLLAKFFPSVAPLVLFLILKTAADLLSHTYKQLE